MQKTRFFRKFLNAGEKFAATLDGPTLVRFNELFDPLSTTAAIALNKPVLRAMAKATVVDRKLRRMKAHEAAKAAGKAARALARANREALAALASTMGVEHANH